VARGSSKESYGRLLVLNTLSPTLLTVVLVHHAQITSLHTILPCTKFIMPDHSRIALATIPSLTFYKDSLTIGRRSKPIQQLTCVGKPCRLYTPDVVRCVNAGGSGTDVDWRCEADLPEALRFGRVEVSCEGWSRPGDPYVLKGSCGLEYRLVQIPDSLRTGENHTRPPWYSRWTKNALNDPSSTIFMIIWISVLLLLLYSFLKSWLGAPRPARRRIPHRGGFSWFPGGGGGGGGGGWFSGNPRPAYTDPPPPYSGPKPNTHSTSQPDQGGWNPGFWTGAALGGLGTYFLNRNRDRTPEPPQQRRPAAPYNWEFPGFGLGGRTVPPFQPNAGYASGSNARMWGGGEDDRGEGSSSGLGQMRRSTGFGGSNVR